MNDFLPNLVTGVKLHEPQKADSFTYNDREPATLNAVVKWRNHLQFMKIEGFAFRLVIIKDAVQEIES